MKKNFNNLALALLRVGLSVLILTHGIPKINMLLNNPSAFPDPLGLGGTPTLIFAIIGEVIAPIFIIIGLKTRIATLPTILTMLTAIFVVHANDPLSVKEKPLLYLIGFITVAIAGAGKYSVDKK